GVELVPGLELQPLDELGGVERLVGPEAGLVVGQRGAGGAELGDQPLVERLRVEGAVVGGRGGGVVELDVARQRGGGDAVGEGHADTSTRPSTGAPYHSPAR